MIPYTKPSIEAADIQAVSRAMRSGWLTQGPIVQEFEEALAAYCGCTYAIAVSSGTAALHCAAGYLFGHEATVLTTPVTFRATVDILKVLRIVPCYTDIDLATGMAADTELAVELAGRPCKHAVLVDSCHSVNRAMRFDNCVARAVSFHYTKNLTTLGEGGAVLTNHQGLAKFCRAFRDHGRGEPELSFGLNYHLPETHAAMGLTQLAKADRLREQKDGWVRRYNKLLESTVVTPPYVEGLFWHVYIIRSERRAEIEQALSAKQIQTRRLYPPLAHLPNADEWYRTSLAIPLFADMTKSEQDRIVRTIREAVK